MRPRTRLAPALGLALVLACWAVRDPGAAAGGAAAAASTKAGAVDSTSVGAATPAAAADSAGVGASAGRDTTRAHPAASAAPHGHLGFTTPPPGKSGGKPTAAPYKIVVPAGAPKVRDVTLGVRHRVFHDFAEEDSVRMHEWFQIGDTPYSAMVADFVPDFSIDIHAHRITSRSTEPRNPAFRILVREKGVAADTAWAFLNMPPHFAPKSLLAFLVLRIDFEDRAPLLRDSTATGGAKHR